MHSLFKPASHDGDVQFNYVEGFNCCNKTWRKWNTFVGVLSQALLPNKLACLCSKRHVDTLNLEFLFYCYLQIINRSNKKTLEQIRSILASKQE